MQTLAYSRAGWGAIALKTVVDDPALSLRISHLLLTDRSAFPALTLPASIAEDVVAIRAGLDGRRNPVVAGGTGGA